MKKVKGKSMLKMFLQVLYVSTAVVMGFWMLRNFSYHIMGMGYLYTYETNPLIAGMEYLAALYFFIYSVWLWVRAFWKRTYLLGE